MLGQNRPIPYYSLSFSFSLFYLLSLRTHIYNTIYKYNYIRRTDIGVAPIVNGGGGAWPPNFLDSLILIDKILLLYNFHSSLAPIPQFNFTRFGLPQFNFTRYAYEDWFEQTIFSSAGFYP